MPPKTGNRESQEAYNHAKSDAAHPNPLRSAGCWRRPPDLQHQPQARQRCPPHPNHLDRIVVKREKLIDLNGGKAGRKCRQTQILLSPILHRLGLLLPHSRRLQISNPRVPRVGKAMRVTKSKLMRNIVSKMADFRHSQYRYFYPKCYGNPSISIKTDRDFI